MVIKAQCPPNIDFERGDFTGWTCYVGGVSAAGGVNTINLYSSGGPVPDQHTMYSRVIDGGTRDYYGDFPVMCPNGSNYSMKLGNTSGEARAEGLSYEFTIPAGQNTYSLIYHYAVVFQDPNHQPYEQPRLELEVTNVTDNELITCSSFTFFPNGSPLPGFFQSPNSDTTAVWCKDWSAVTINLNNKAGKTIRLFFKTGDCTFRRHFGYAYIDVNTGCSSEFTGATYCPDDTTVSVTAPHGYQAYTWYNSTFTQVLGNQQTINFTPPPPPGTTIAVAITPYDGYGCPDTLYANMVDTLKLQAKAGIDKISCNNEGVIIGDIPSPGVVYSWSPSAWLSNPAMSNPRATPATTTLYELTVRSTGGGCMNKDSVIVTPSFVDSSMQLLGKSLFCITSEDSAVLVVQPTTSIQWTMNSNIILGATQPRYRVNQTGSYYAILTNSDGCSIKTRTETITIEIPRPGIRYPLQYAVMNIPVDLQARTFGESVSWKPSIYLNNASTATPVFNASFELEQLYTIDITTTAGCMTVDTQLVKVIKEVKVYVPTAFTPNNDGLNDYIKPIMLGIKDLQYFRIYNRWGQVVYDYNSGDRRGWNGKVGGELQTTSVYVWMFSGIGYDKKIHTQKGTLTLIR
ncbi:MAG: T9SS type B sorting domain-containing protein [Chitinophagaceae bacterium]|nr:T9SS type B sorting domain-containing protein [Chitinophagaceae bacterium]